MIDILDFAGQEPSRHEPSYRADREEVLRRSREREENMTRLVRLRKAAEIERIAGNDDQVFDYRLKAARLARHLRVELTPEERQAERAARGSYSHSELRAA